MSPFKLAKGINDITKSRIANVTILNKNYVLLETQKLIMKNNLNFLLPNRFARFPFPYHHTALDFKKVSSNANNWMPVLTKELL